MVFVTRPPSNCIRNDSVDILTLVVVRFDVALSSMRVVVMQISTNYVVLIVDFVDFCVFR